MPDLRTRVQAIIDYEGDDQRLEWVKRELKRALDETAMPETDKGLVERLRELAAHKPFYNRNDDDFINRLAKTFHEIGSDDYTKAWSAQKSNYRGSVRKTMRQFINTLLSCGMFPAEQSALTEAADAIERLEWERDTWKWADAAKGKQILEFSEALTTAEASLSAAQAEIAELRGANEAFAALDVADRLIERAYGTDVPKEWNDAYRAVSDARSLIGGNPNVGR